MKGFIRDIMEKDCPNPTAEPKYYDEEIETAPKDEHDKGGHHDSTDKEVEDLESEMLALKLLEEEMELLEAEDAEMAMLESLEKEFTNLSIESESAKKMKKDEKMVNDLVTMGFPHEMATWAVKESKSDWEMALEIAHEKIQKDEYDMLVQKEKDEKAKAKTLARRGPASPCTSTSMPPPPVPVKKVKSPKVVTPVCTLF